MGKLKYIAFILIIWYYWFLYYQIQYPIKTRATQKTRWEATFLQLNESILNELEDKKTYYVLDKIREEDKTKTMLFEDPQIEYFNKQ